ncbi:MAG: undecaprenyl-diphosphate phosphatase [Micromonosporaceae bacterium]
MELWQALLLGIVEGVTEFFPISSTGHLVAVEKLLGMRVDDPAVIGFTAVIQVGAIAAVVVYFARDIARLTAGFVRGLVSPAARRHPDYRLAWYVVVGTLPIVVVGFVAQDLVTRVWSLWTVVGGMLVFSLAMVYAERVGRRDRDVARMTLRDALVVGAGQVLSLVPGVSRAGATITTGLLVGLDRVAATRYSFYLAIPALVGAGVLELDDAQVGDSVPTAALVVGTVTSFVVAYLAIAWLLRFLSRHSLIPFVWYRVAASAVLAALLLTGTITAT